MKSFSVLAATIAIAAVSGLAGPALATAPASLSPAAAPAATTPAEAPMSAEQLQGVDGTRLVLRNTTDKLLMLFSPDGGLPDNSKEHYMATLSPGDEYTFSGYNDSGHNATDVYVRIFTATRNGDTGEVTRNTMVATVGAHNPSIGYPFVRVTAGKYVHEKSKKEVPHTRTLTLSEHETHDSWRVENSNKFRAWVHRDGDADGADYKTLKMTLHDIDTVPTLDMMGGGAAPA